jgi:hypothetical protein
MSHTKDKVKIEVSVDELLLIMFCIRTAVLTGINADIAAVLYERLDKIASGI